MRNFKNKAFSLVELSIVILIIGILLVGIAESSRLISEFKLTSARSLTQGSNVNSISGLVLWYETTLTQSFDAEELEDEDEIAIWRDINPQTSNKNNGIADTENYPSYLRDCINSLPCLTFSGGDAFFFNGAILVGKEYTIFLVEQRSEPDEDFHKIFGGSGGNDESLFIGYTGATSLRYGHYDLFDDYSIPAFNGKEPRLHTFQLNIAGDSRDYYINGIIQAGSTSGEVNYLQSYDNAVFGRSYPDSTSLAYEGDIGEVIIFDRKLKTSEREDVEEYLRKKWKL